MQLTLADLLKLGTTVVSISAAFFALSQGLARLEVAHKVTHEQVQNNSERMEKLESRMNHMDQNITRTNIQLQSLNRLLYEKQLLRSPVAQFRLPPDAETPVVVASTVTKEEDDYVPTRNKKRRSVISKVFHAPVYVGKGITAVASRAAGGGGSQ